MKLLRVHQNLVSNPIADIRAAVQAQLDSLNLSVPRGDVAVTAGSRGISNIPAILRAAGDWLRDHGARPFLFPAMGSHNGGTAEGQRAMVESLGMTEEATGMSIRASMDVVKIGTVSTGDVWMDRIAYESAGVLVVNRIKLHTCFAGPVQSGLAKMIVVGMGKTPSATTFHSAPTPQMKDMLLEMGQLLLDSGKIWAGLAILEDGYDQTAELHAVRPADILRREPELLDRHRHYFPRLPLEHINVLVVDQIGKIFSGTGMDTNVIGYRGVRDGEDLSSPVIHVIAALSLAEGSHGNAIGVGLADFITRRLRDAIDEQKTFLNVYTTGHMGRAKIPVTFRNDEELVNMLTKRYGENGWLWIPNTLHLETLYASENLRDELAANSICKVEPAPIELAFQNGRQQLTFNGV
jgi:Lactate racemase N-terminal domain